MSARGRRRPRSGRATRRRRQRWRANWLRPRAIRSRAALAKSCSTSSPSACSTCPANRGDQNARLERRTGHADGQRARRRRPNARRSRICANCRGQPRRDGFDRATLARVRRTWAGPACWCRRATAASGSARSEAGIIARALGARSRRRRFCPLRCSPRARSRAPARTRSRRDCCPRIAAAEAVVAVAIDEASKHRPTATRPGDARRQRLAPVAAPRPSCSTAMWRTRSSSRRAMRSAA